MPARRLALFLALAYFLLVGGSLLGLLNSVRFVSAIVGSIVVVLWIRAIRRDPDRSDLLMVAGLLLFLLACVTSQLQRFSFDSALTALGFVSMFGLARRELAEESARRQLVLFLAVLGALFAALLAVSWGGVWLRWISLTGTS